MPVLKRIATAAVLLFGVATVEQSRLRAVNLSEYEVKAAFLVNFAKFIEWPASTFPDGTAPVTLAVVGDDPFGSDLDDTVKGNTLGGHPIAVKRVDWHDDLKKAHIVFIAGSEKRRIGDILQRIDSASVLTVSDVDGFCDAGGVIAFVLDNSRVRFEVNVNAAQRKKLKISSRLLSLAASVHTRGN